MVDYGKAFKTPFSDVKKLFAGTFIILGFFVLMMIVYFAFVLPYMISSILKGGSLTYTPTLFSTLFLYIITFLISAIPLAFFVRYGINAAKKKFVIPSWRDLKGLFMDGIFLNIIMWIYYIPPTIVYYLISGISPFSLRVTSEAQQMLIANILARLPLIIAVVFPLYLLLIYLLPVTLLRFMETKKFSDGFDFSTIFRKAFTLKYLGAWLLSLLIAIGSGILMIFIMFLLSITIIGIIPLLLVVMPMFYYVLILVLFGIYGQAYGEIK